MNSKQKKQILEKYLKINGRIKELEQEREILVANTTEESKKTVDLIDKEKKELLNTQSQIMIAISKLSNITERRLIYLKYIKALPHWKIANELGYSYDYINHLHLVALQHIELTI
ncbi:MAG: DUF1492 domain-containing protein [Clostridia bacterium]|nr:DUF1492 domain-containing protein [Clostridia bacterium]